MNPPQKQHIHQIIFICLLMVVGWGQDCEEGYVWINSYLDNGCYNENQINFLQEIIDSSISTLNMDLDCNDDGIIEPLELNQGVCNNWEWVSLFSWSEGNLFNLDLSNTGISVLPDSFCQFFDEIGYINTYNNFLCPPYPECIENYELEYQICYDCSNYGNNFTFINYSNTPDITYLNDDYYFHSRWWYHHTENSFNNGYCYYQPDLNVLQDIIVINPNIQIIHHHDCGYNSSGTDIVLNDTPIIIHPLKLGSQRWENGRLIQLYLNDYDYDQWKVSFEINQLPSSISSLTYLESLILNYNYLTVFPSELTLLNNLSLLNLSNNQLTGQIPNSICNLGLDWSSYNNSISNNQLCPPYPDCGDGPITSEDEQDISECLSVSEQSLPIQYTLHQPFPNPFNPTISISFSIPEQSQTSLKIYDIKGNLISTLLNQTMNVGHHQIEWNGENLSSGTYFIRINSGEFSDVKKVVLVK